MTETIMVADDDREIVEIISDTLCDEGYKVVCAYNGAEILDKMNSKKIDLFIIDIMMPKMDGLEALSGIKKLSNSPVIILSARDRDIDKVIGLKIGADDYVPKPFSMDELVARVDAHLRRERRRTKDNVNIIKIRNLELNKNTYQLKLGGEPVELSTKEFQILSFLVENKGRVLSREQIYNALWNDNFYGDLNTVTVHIKNLRSKIDPHGELIKTVWGVGYKMDGEA